MTGRSRWAQQSFLISAVLKGHFCQQTGKDGLQHGGDKAITSQTARCYLLSNEYVYDCQNNLATTSIHNLPCNSPPPPPQPGHWWLCSTLPCNCPLPNKAAPHDSLAAPCLRRTLSFNAALFMRSLVPCSLLYLSSVLWLLRRPPQLLSPAQAYVRGETDLNTVSTVIVPPQPSLPWRTLEQHLTPPASY